MNEERPKISDIDLYDLLEELLGIHDCVPLGRLAKNAEVIQFKLNKAGNLLYCVRDFDQNGNPKKSMLWRYDAWVSDSSRWERARKKAEDERIQKFIDDENIGRTIHAIMDEYMVTEEQARHIARKWVTNKDVQKLNALGIKLKERKDEL